MYLADWLHFPETKTVSRPGYKIIDARTHGIIDYCHAAFFLGMSIVVRKNKAASLVALGTGAFALTQALLTDYPLGAKRDLTFETHGKIDAAFCSLSWALPRIFGFQNTAAAKVFEINSYVETSVVVMTDFDNQRARLQAARR